MEGPGREHPNCIACGRWKEARSPFMPMAGVVPADVVFVGEAPGKHEDRLGEPFIGASGQLLRAGEEKFQLTEYRLVHTNAARCWATDNRRPTTQEIKLCRPFLLDDLDRAQPKLVVALGAVALLGTLKQSNITERRGAVVRDNGRLYLPTFHPANVLRDPRHKKDFLGDLQQARTLLEDALGSQKRIDTLRRRYKMLTTEREVRELLAMLAKNPPTVFDTEFEPLDWLSPELTLLGVTFTNRAKKAWFIPVDHEESPFRGCTWLKPLLAEFLSSAQLITHNADADIAVAHKTLGVPLRNLRVVFDTMYASIALHGPEASNALKTLSYSDADTGGYDEEVDEFKRQSFVHQAVFDRIREIERMASEPDKLTKTGKIAKRPEPKNVPTATEVQAALTFHDTHGRLFTGLYGSIPLRMLGDPYAAADGDTTAQLARKYRPKLDAEGQWNWYREVLLPAHRLNVVMRDHGLLLDWDEWAKRHTYFTVEKEAAYARVFEIAEVREFIHGLTSQKKKFSLKSRPQMLTLLFTVLGLPKSSLKTKKGGDALSYNALLEIQKAAPHPVLDAMLGYSSINQYLGYLKGYARLCYPDGRLHANFHNFTESGRRGSSEPNTQNWSETGDRTKAPTADDPYNLRMCVRAAPGWTFVGGDFAQQEFRLAACYAKDDAMIEGCLAPKDDDAHTRLAKRLGIPRHLAKIVNFGVMYGASAQRIQAEVEEKAGIIWTLEFCEQVVADSKVLYDELWATIEGVQRFATVKGYVVNRLGHRRLTPHASASTERSVRERALREAWNHVVQSLGHDLLQLAMGRLQEFIWAENLSWRICNDLHDGFMVEVPEAEAAACAGIAKHFMETTPVEVLGDWLQVPLPAEMKVGAHWGFMEELAA